jgi:hypothetical protein
MFMHVPVMNLIQGNLTQSVWKLQLQLVNFFCQKSFFFEKFC